MQLVFFLPDLKITLCFQRGRFKTFMASHGEKSTMLITTNIVLPRVPQMWKGRAQSGSSVCVGTAKLPINTPNSLFGLNPASDFNSLIFFPFLKSFWAVWIQVKVSSFGCLVQGSSAWMQRQNQAVGSELWGSLSWV